MNNTEVLKAQKINPLVNSEIGKLEGVILHTPGSEVENMTPETVQKALYSDILNLEVANYEYDQFRRVLEKYTSTYQVRSLLEEALKNTRAKSELVHSICDNEKVHGLREELLFMEPDRLARALIEGVELKRDNLSRYLSRDRYELEPLHNFFFTRDASVTVGNEVFISKMASRIRDRESQIMETIFDYHPLFETNTVNPASSRHMCKEFSFEGGDLLVAREDILLIGTGSRTSPKGIDFIIDHYKRKKVKQHLIVQELPYEPESFIHLDMVFTFVDKDLCMIYEPLIIHNSRFLTIHIHIENGKVKITEEPTIPHALRKLGLEIKTINCGGSKDIVSQEREQWHSGANFFAFEPGKIIGYGRNRHTIEELNKHGFDVIKAKDICKGKESIETHKKCVVTIEGSELSRGGGGCRCMTMPVRRSKIDW